MCAQRPSPVLLIACAGRSGSTLLDRIVGNCDGFFSTGELRFVWERSFQENQLCGCGRPFDECPFWEEVSRGVFGTATANVDPSAAVGLRRALDEIRHVPWLVQPFRPPAFNSMLRSYGELWERLYATVLAVSGERVVVDSSGDATHGLILARCPGIELHVVHLVRDPRAVAFSWKRSRKRPEIHWKAENMPVESVRTSALRWTAHNAAAERLRTLAASYRRVRYEDFTADPADALSDMLAPFQWASGLPHGLAERRVELGTAHTVSGNPMRFKQGALHIKLDDEWRRAMGAGDRRLVTAMTLPLLARYGYPLRVLGPTASEAKKAATPPALDSAPLR